MNNLVDLEALKQRFLTICKEKIHREGIDSLTEWLEKSDFFTAPASTRYHGCYAGGLVEHSLNVYDRLSEYCKMFSDKVNASEESIAISSLFHDLCKVNFYKADTRNVKENGVWVAKPCYTIEEKLSYGGHGSKSVFLVERFLRLEIDEAIAINCHMGCWDGNKEVGGAFERCSLAFLLHIADETAAYLFEER